MAFRDPSFSLFFAREPAAPFLSASNQKVTSSGARGRYSSSSRTTDEKI